MTVMTIMTGIFINCVRRLGVRSRGIERGKYKDKSEKKCHCCHW